MLEVPRADTVDDWPDVRIWAELQERLHAKGEPDITQGELIERDVPDLRVRVAEPMHDRRVYLTGDAVHLITPAAGKGMNLAIQDALELGCALRERYGPDPSGKRLARYSSMRLPAIWRTQEFSNWMLTLCTPASIPDLPAARSPAPRGHAADAWIDHGARNPEHMMRIHSIWPARSQK